MGASCFWSPSSTHELLSVEKVNNSFSNLGPWFQGLWSPRSLSSLVLACLQRSWEVTCASKGGVWLWNFYCCFICSWQPAFKVLYTSCVHVTVYWRHGWDGKGGIGWGWVLNVECGLQTADTSMLLGGLWHVGETSWALENQPLSFPKGSWQKQDLRETGK